VFVGFPEFSGTATIERVGRRQRYACEPAAAARSFRVGFYLGLMRVLSIANRDPVEIGTEAPSEPIDATNRLSATNE
jgi:hypothetical protein